MRGNCPDEPVLRPYHGLSFRYSMPAGWRARETPNGVDMSAPDGLTSVSFSLLGATPGQEEPLGFLAWVLAQVGVRDARFLTVREVALPGNDPSWRMLEVDTVYTLRGARLRARWTCAVCQCGGEYTALLWGCQAPEEIWERRSRWLPRVAESVVLLNRSRLSAEGAVGPLPCFPSLAAPSAGAPAEVPA